MAWVPISTNASKIQRQLETSVVDQERSPTEILDRNSHGLKVISLLVKQYTLMSMLKQIQLA